MGTKEVPGLSLGRQGQEGDGGFPAWTCHLQARGHPTSRHDLHQPNAVA